MMLLNYERDIINEQSLKELYLMGQWVQVEIYELIRLKYIHEK